MRGAVGAVLAGEDMSQVGFEAYPTFLDQLVGKERRVGRQRVQVIRLRVHPNEARRGRARHRRAPRPETGRHESGTHLRVVDAAAKAPSVFPRQTLAIDIPPRLGLEFASERLKVAVSPPDGPRSDGR